MKRIYAWLTDKGNEASSLEDLMRRFTQMLEDGRHIFDAASNALLGGTDPAVIRNDLFETDQRINKNEQDLRREIVVHGSIYGTQVFPTLLVLMSLAKDAERIGDYAKNLFDLATHSPDFGGPEERDPLIEFKDEISRILVRARNLFDNEDTDKAHAFLNETNALEKRCDDQIDRLLAVRDANRAGNVLTYRYFKRVISHTDNVVTSLVVPIHKLDFRDEPRES